MYYNEKMAWIRDCRNVTQKEIATYLGIRQQQYARYEKGINVMPVTYLPKICEYLNVSADYLLGLSPDLPYPKD
ncbi:MAG: helix-turn-helix transcriptional regulator [Clostridia bacterium]|nr:helix-turn-helix transcriptional regulator [Clostridia bacterium]